MSVLFRLQSRRGSGGDSLPGDKGTADPLFEHRGGVDRFKGLGGRGLDDFQMVGPGDVEKEDRVFEICYHCSERSKRILRRSQEQNYSLTQ